VGETDSEGSGNRDALIVKFNPDLSIATRKIYGGGRRDIFFSVYSDGTHIYAVGETWSEGSGDYDALIVKFNPDLSIAERKIYGGINWDIFRSVYSDGTHIYAVGWSESEGSGDRDALIVKFNPDLSIAERKIFGGINWDVFRSVYSDGTHIYAVGETESEGSGFSDALIVKFSKSLFLKPCFSLILKDSALTLQGSGLTLQNSALTLQGSGLTLQNSALILQDSELVLDGCCFRFSFFKEARP